VQQPLVSGDVVFAAYVKAGDAHFEKKDFDSDITLLASLVIAVDNSSSYEPIATLFCIFCPFCCG